LVLAVLGGAGAGVAHAEMYRCQQADGGVTFQAEPCSLAELVTPEPARPPASTTPAATVAPAKVEPPPAPKPPPVAAPAPVRAATAERSITAPAPVAIPAKMVGEDEDGFVKPTKRKRDVLETSAQFERCRADVPGFAEKSAVIYAAWRQRHRAVLAEYSQLLSAKVRAGRRGELTLPLQLCTDEWLAEIEPLSRMPDPRFQTVEKTWQVFLGALMTGDRDTLMNCLAGRAELRWKQRTARLSDEDMRRIAGSIRGLKVQWGDDYEKEGLVADNDNRVTGIAFRNVNEEWKIVELGNATTVALPLAPAIAAASAPAVSASAAAPAASAPAVAGSAPLKAE
jgi:hypothetical protein